MSHAFVKNHIHLVFGVKDRRIKIVHEIMPELWSYIAGICRNQEMAAIAVNGMNDHAHVLFHFAAGDVSGRRCPPDQDKFIQMDERTSGEFRMAARLWGFQRQHFIHFLCGEIYPRTG